LAAAIKRAPSVGSPTACTLSCFTNNFLIFPIAPSFSVILVSLALLQRAAISRVSFNVVSFSGITALLLILKGSSPVETSITFPPVYTCLTVILFSVRVPVLSEQITLAQPNVSTAGSFLINAFLFSIL
jgi:hypothetical protein